MVKKIFICLVFVTIAYISFGQHFTQDGKVVGLPATIINNSTSITIPLAPSPSSVRSLKKLLYNKINKTLDNLEDEDLGLKNLYEFIWGQEIVADIDSELVHLKKYCRDTTLSSLPIDHYNFKYMPSEQELHDMLYDPKIYDTTSDIRDNAININLYRTDPFIKWFINYYNAATKEFENNGIVMDHIYKHGWRQLESLYKSTDSLSKLYSKKITSEAEFDCTAFLDAKKLTLDLNNKINDNYIFKTVLKSNFYKKILWFTDGILLTDPFLQISGENAYPDNEKYLFKDSLFKTFKPQSAASILEKLQTGRILLNKVSIPKAADRSLIHVINYDAANWNTSGALSMPKVLPEDQNYSISINNIARNSAVKIEFTKDAIPDQSNFMAGFNKILDDAGTAALSIAGYSTGLGPFLSGLAKHPVNAALVASNVVPSLDTAVFITKRGSQENASRDIHNIRKNNITLTVNKLKYVLSGTGQDSAIIITTYAAQKKLCDRDELVDDFLKQNKSDTSHPRSTENALRGLVISLTEQFDSYIPKYRKNQLRILLDSITNTHNKLFQLITLFNRSLPPGSLELKTDNDPLYHSVVTEVPLDGGNKITYNITERTAADKDSVISYATSRSVKAGKKSILQVSLGIAYTLTQYKRQIISSSNNQLNYLNDNDQVRAVAGLHIYPRKLFMLNNKLLGGNNLSKNGSDFRNNFSFFIGLGIPKPLENYYTGLSMDVVPGLRLIGGIHFFKYINYVVQNNTIASQKNKVGTAGPFIALTFDAATFGKIIGLFKN